MHAVHTLDVDATATSLYRPRGHPVHAEVPVVSAVYAPVAHAVHTVADALAL